ncbi:hypothetical protein J7K07_00630 [Candidatus Bathyarchaeota archaeon]|nr:hypothetical protein [Candidatus Bathyarchaeota archaeon]
MPLKHLFIIRVPSVYPVLSGESFRVTLCPRSNGNKFNSWILLITIGELLGEEACAY